MRHFRSVAVAVVVYGSCLALTAVSPSRADAQVVYSNYSVSPYGSAYNYQVYPAGFGYYNYVQPQIYAPAWNYPNWNNWGGNPHWTGYPQWYVNYVRWNSPGNPYRSGWRRW